MARKRHVRQKANNNTLIFKFPSESLPETSLKLKIEINCREHFAVLGYITKDFLMESSWFNASCQVKTYKFEELLGTKMRALYQRRKGRDLYDLYSALTRLKPNITQIIQSYKNYMQFVVEKPPTRKQFIQNIEKKLNEEDFLGDTKSLLSPDEIYNSAEAWEIVRQEIIDYL